MQESAHLSFRQGSADKVYNASLQEADGGWIVNFSYGRRGKPLRAGTKTPQPVEYEVAKKAYDQLIQSKVAKGYTCDDEETFKAAGGAQIAEERTFWLPQLLNPVEREDLPGAFQGWKGIYAQVKHDGERRAILISDDDIVPANRRGLRTTVMQEIQDELEDLAGALHGDYILDCEDMGSYLVIFDIIRPGESFTFAERSANLELVQEHLERLQTTRLRIDHPVQISGMPELDTFIADAELNNEEGVVFRNSASRYTEGRPNSGGDALKLKFYASATCIVDAVHSTKSSISLALWDNNERISVGNCTIPPNYEMPTPGELVEIKYLYAYRGGSLYQPQYKGVRGDLDESAANTDQLKYKN